MASNSKINPFQHCQGTDDNIECMCTYRQSILIDNGHQYRSKIQNASNVVMKFTNTSTVMEICHVL